VRNMVAERRSSTMWTRGGRSGTLGRCAVEDERELAVLLVGPREDGERMLTVSSGGGR
jgi:hypothetical protein